MQLFNSGIFWFVEGILFVVILLALRAWARDRGLPMSPWKWGLFLLWLAFAGFTLAFVGTSFGEGEPTAGARGGLFFGLLTVISGVGVWRVLLAGRSAGAGDLAGDA
jgi:hypothetical protein